MPVLIRLFFAGRKDPPKRRQPVKATASRGLAEAFRENTLTQVRTRRTPPESSDISPSLGTTHISLQTTARPTQSSEPILIPKLRISFADFPYLHFSNDQRLLTLETCCGYGYGLARKSHSLTRIFKGRREHSGHHKSRGALRFLHPYLRANRFQGLGTLQRKDNSPQGSRRRLRARLRYRS